MKLKCLKCGERLDIDKDDIKSVAQMIERHNLDVTVFLDSLSPVGGKCKDGDRHIYEFDDEFDKIIHDLAKDYIGIKSGIISETKECNDMCIVRKELGDKLRDISESIENKIDKIKQFEIDIEKIQQKCEDLTGTSNIELWSIRRPK